MKMTLKFLLFIHLYFFAACVITIGICLLIDYLMTINDPGPPIPWVSVFSIALPILYLLFWLIFIMYKLENKTLILVFIPLFSYCSEADPTPTDKRLRYTFNLTAADSSPLDARIWWGVNNYQYADPVKSLGYASSFRLWPTDVFVVSIESNTEIMQLVFYRDAILQKTVVVHPGQKYEFNYELE